MSANRSVQAAQRRRAGPPEPAAPGRGPQPSINSAQLFANQQRSGPGPNIPNGRLAGQHATMAQKNMMSGASQDTYQDTQANLNSVNKMTLAQAITLITLRLGKVETQLINGFASQSSRDHNMTLDDDNVLVDKNVITSLISRIDALEKKQTGSGSGSGTVNNQDISLLKQQFETIKPMVIQSKNTSVAFKKLIDDLKIELNETKELIGDLQKITMDNSNKILAFNSIFNTETDNLDNDNDNDENYTNNDTDTDNMDLNSEIVAEFSSHIPNAFNEIETNGPSFTNLKDLIEQELNA